MIALVDLVPIGNLSDFQQSHRYVLSFRSWTHPSLHTQLLIYRSKDSPTSTDKWYSIANECPHLGLPLEQGDIEDIQGPPPFEEEEEEEEEEERVNQPLIICPFHQYDYGLEDGKSSSGLKACTYKVEAKGDGKLWIQPPGEKSDDFRLLGVRMVSERFAESTPSSTAIDISSLLSSISLSSSSSSSSPTLPISPQSHPTPISIVGWCRTILLAPSPSTKVALTRHLVSEFRSGKLTRISSPSDPPQPLEPYRDPLVFKTLPAGKMQNRGKGGSVSSRIKLLHALASIEQWAIDLAIDCISRFHSWKLGTRDGKQGDKLPWNFFSDFLKVAEDEAKHFSLLEERLREMGSWYGEFAVHNGLWESALETSQSLFSRLAIIHLVHEARGLDSNPVQIKRCRQAGDLDSANLLEIIHYDEITHVAAGHRHFTSLCSSHNPPLDPIKTFRSEVETHFYGLLRGPFNEDDRERAGMGKGYYEGLKGRGNGLGPKEVKVEGKVET